MNKNIIEQLKKYEISNEDFNKIEEFFEEFEKKCSIEYEDKMKLENDFIKALLFYFNNGYSTDEALKRLDIKNMGNFYSDKITKSFELDDFAKIILPINNNKFTFSFRVSIYLTKDIIPELLQVALDFTIKRFPIFATKLKRNFWGYKLESNRQHYYIELENDIPCRPINFKEEDSQLFKILYFKNKISLEILHILTDGTGAVAFLKTLVIEYLKLVENDIIIEENVYDINAPIDNEELENPFKNISINNIKPEFANKILLRPVGKALKKEPHQIVQFRLDSEKLKSIAKKYNTTVTGYLTSVMFIANKAVTNNKNGYTNVYIPINLRKYYPTKSIRNFCTLCNIYIKNEEISDFDSLVEKVNKNLKENLNTNTVNKLIVNTQKISNSFYHIPFSIKKIISKIICNSLSNKYYTNELSNLGEIKFSENISKYIESMDLFLNIKIIAKITCAVITANNITTFSIFKSIENTSFEEELYKQFLKDDIILKLI